MLLEELSSLVGFERYLGPFKALEYVLYDLLSIRKSGFSQGHGNLVHCECGRGRVHSSRNRVDPVELVLEILIQ